jgi:Na+(H+)/acetate symporter ActP
MNLLGLPCSTAFPLILGFFFSLYAAIGAIVPLQLTVKQLTIISLMLLTAHTLILEAIVFKKLKIRYVNLIVFRIIMAFILGYFVNLVMI